MAQKRDQSSFPVWLFPNLLSLDAPLVAVVWQSFLAYCYVLPIRDSGRVVLFLSVWCIYLADRLLDVRLPARTLEPARHRFYRRYHKQALWLLASVALLNLLLIIFWLRPAVFHNGLIALAAISLYFVLVHTRRTPFRLPKELVAALLFTLGTFLVPWTIAAHPSGQLLRPAIAFLLLCFANLVAIETWEWRELRGGAQSPPHPLTVASGRFFLVWVPLLALACLLPGDTLFYRAVALSAVATALLFARGSRMSLEARRALVDGVLLSPLLFLL
jgi:hypothetical protein